MNLDQLRFDFNTARRACRSYIRDSRTTTGRLRRGTNKDMFMQALNDLGFINSGCVSLLHDVHPFQAEIAAANRWLPDKDNEADS